MSVPLTRAGLLSRTRRLARETAALVPGLPLRQAVVALVAAVALILAACGTLIAAFGPDVRLAALPVGAVVLVVGAWGAGSLGPSTVSALTAGPVAALLIGRLGSIAPLAVATFAVDYVLGMVPMLAALGLLVGPSLLIEAGWHAMPIGLAAIAYVVAVGFLRLIGFGVHLRVLSRTARRERPWRLLAVHVTGSLVIFSAIGWAASRAVATVDATELADAGRAIAGAVAVPFLLAAGLVVVAGAAARFAGPLLARACAEWLERDTRARAAKGERRERETVTGSLEAKNQLVLLNAPGLLRHGVTQVAGAGTAVGGLVVGIVAGGFDSAGPAPTLMLALGMLTATAMTGAAMKTFTSVDADGPAVTLVLRAPRGPQRLVAAKARLHARSIALVGFLIGTLAIALTPASLGNAVAIAACALLAVIASCVGVVVGTALFPRLDWTMPDQIGAHPGAQSFEFAVDVVAWMGISMLAAGAAGALSGVSAPPLAGVALLGLACWAGAALAPRVATITFNRFERT